MKARDVKKQVTATSVLLKPRHWFQLIQEAWTCKENLRDKTMQES